jgi:two-component system, sensor histidine kinase and response regulator
VTFDLRSVVEESAVPLAARAQQDDLELTCRIDSSLPAALRGDPGRLRQVLLNLLGNAVKFTSAGEVNLTARLVDEDVGDRVMVELSVRDTGIGMTAATLEQLLTRSPRPIAPPLGATVEPGLVWRSRDSSSN